MFFCVIFQNLELSLKLFVMWEFNAFIKMSPFTPCNVLFVSFSDNLILIMLISIQVYMLQSPQIYILLSSWIGFFSFLLLLLFYPI